jgi:hypothetical protein
MGRVHKLSDTCKENEEKAAKEDLVRALRRVVDAQLGPDATFREREEATLNGTNEAAKHYFKQELQDMADSYGDEVMINGIIYRRSHQPSQGNYHSLCGTINVNRALFRQVGQHNGPTVVPLELEAGLIEGVTPALGYSIALGCASDTSRQYVEQMAAAHRQIPSRSTIERIGKIVGKKAKEEAPRIERYLRQSEGVPEEAVAVSLGLDRTTKRLEGEPPKTRRKKRNKPYVRHAPDPIDVNFHMAYVGTVSFMNQDGDCLVTRKYAATHHDGAESVVPRMIADVRAAKLRQPELNVGLVQDGSPEM